jgi:HSP20 family molecular chaperone IbpA
LKEANMNPSTQLKSRQQAAEAPAAQTAATKAPAAQAAAASALVPPVDIVEDPAGITLKADLPGVGREQLDVRVESGHLLIEGDIRVAVPEHLSVMYAEVRGGHYRRSFALSNELDSERVEANLKDGVLTIRIPRTEAARPRRVEVQFG